MSAISQAAQAGLGAPPEALLTQLQWLEEQYQLRSVDLSAFPPAAISNSRLVVHGGARRLCGWSIIETTGTAPAAIRLFDGKSATDQTLVRINLAANESTRDWLDLHGLIIETGHVWCQVLSGSVEGVLWVR